MRFVDVICLSVILALFSASFTGIFSQIIRLQNDVDNARKKSDSLIFISESFCNSCSGKGFSSLDEWKRVCACVWQLDFIEWECVGGEDSGLYCGKWKGPYGSGEVYGAKQKK